MPSLGSDSWRGVDNYDEGDVLHSRAVEFLAAVKWDILAEIASQIRGGIRCKFSNEYSLGHFNLVRRLLFDDGVSWVARLRLPLLPNFFGDREALDVQSSMRIEIATTKFLRQKTIIPVPEIFVQDLTQNNAVGAPYMLLECLPGNTALEMAAEKGCRHGVFGTLDQNERFWSQVADIHAQLVSIKLDQIGSLYEKGEGFEIGPEIETRKGPWGTADAYYSDLAEHVLRTAENDAGPDVRGSRSFELPKLFLELMRMYSMPAQQPSFRLCNRDFRAHNLLVNGEFEIIALIDLDGVMAAPIEYVAQLPLFMGMNPTAPGHIETRPLFLKRMEEKPLSPRYVNLFLNAAREIGGDVHEVTAWLLSDAASIVRGLVNYGGHQAWVNDIWMASYERLLRAKLNNNINDG